ncbi:MAG: hypothetical protein ACM3XM_20930 [Mycobacterium leprae]
MKRILWGLAVVLWLAGCSRGVPQPSSAPVTPSEAPTSPSPAVAAATPVAEYPAENTRGLTGPFWGPPGTTVLAGDGSVLSQSYQPLSFNGRLLQPVKVRDVTYLLHADADKLWLGGTMYDAIGQLALTMEPQALAPLPYRTGDTWALWGPGRGLKVAGFQELSTPAGTFPTVVLVDPESGVREWFSPGIGLVQQSQGGGVTLVAQRVEQLEPPLLAKVKQIAPDLTAIIANERVYDQTGRVLADFQYDPNSGRRPSADWWQMGSQPVMRWGTWSQGDPNWKQTFLTYEPKSRTFQPLKWYFPDGSVRTELVGTVILDADKASFLTHDEYPWGSYTFHYADGAMRVAEHHLTYADSEVRFVDLVNHYLDAQSFIGLFADPALGKQAYAWAYQAGRNSLTGSTPRPQTDGSWTLEGRTAKVQFTLVKHDKDYRITSWRTEP